MPLLPSVLLPLACLVLLLVAVLPSPCLSIVPAVTTLPYSSLWQGFVPFSVSYSNRTGLLYQLGSDVWEDTSIQPYLTIANLTTGRILHRQHYAEAHPELQLYYIEHLIFDSDSSHTPLLVILLWSGVHKTSYILRADGWTGEELSLVAMPYELWLIGMDATGSMLYTFFAGGNEFVAFDPATGKRIQAFNATSSKTNIYAGCVHPHTGYVYLHDTDLSVGTSNRIVVVSPADNSVVSSFDLPSMNPGQAALLDTQLAVDSSGRFLYVFLSITHPDNVVDWVVHQYDVSVANVSTELRVWDINELDSELSLQGQISAGPAGSDWLVVEDTARQAYWQQSVDVNTTVLVGLPILPFNFHVLVDSDTHHVFVSLGDETEITVLEVNEQSDLVQQFVSGNVDCGHAGFYAPIAALDFHKGADHGLLLVPQCNQTVQVFDRNTAQWVGQHATNQSVNLVIIATDRTHHKLYMTSDASNTVLEIDLATWYVTRQFITGGATITADERIRCLVVDETRGLLYAGEYNYGRLYVFSLDQPSKPLARYNYSSPSNTPWGFTSIALSANGTQLFASLNTDMGETQIAVIDTNNGQLVQQLVYPSLGDGRYFYNIGGLALDTERDVFYLSAGEEDGVFVTYNFSSYVVAPSSFDSRIRQAAPSIVSAE